MKPALPLVALAALAVALRSSAAPDASAALSYDGQEVTNIRLPLKRYENGNLMAVFAAGRAKIENGVYKARDGVALLYFGEDGGTNGCIRTASASFDPDPKRQVAVCDGFTTFDITGGIHLEGTNVTVFAMQEKARIETNAVLTIRTNGSAVNALKKLKTK